MSAPKLYDISETARMVRMSTSWLYRNAGVTVPVTRIAGSRRLFWTEAQIAEIIAAGAQPAKADRTEKRPLRTQSGVAPRKTKTPPPTTGKIPQARPERSRHYRPQSAA